MTPRFRLLGIPIALMSVVCAAVAMEAASDGPQPQSAPTPTRATDATSSKVGLPEVTIEARRQALERQVRIFVDKLTHSRRFPDPDQPAPRWVEPLCFEVVGLPQKYAEFVAAQIVRIATSVGAPVRKECSRLSANFYALFTPNPAETLRYLDRHPLMLQNDVPEISLSQVERFLHPAKSPVVRVWHDAIALARNGTPCAVGPTTGHLECGDNMGGSRIILTSAPSFERTLVVIDSRRIEGIQLGQISAYIAMVGLVDIDNDVNLEEAQSILGLFTDPPKKRAEGLTEWDHAFLSGLYRTGQWNAQQRGQIAGKMIDEIAH